MITVISRHPSDHPKHTKYLYTISIPTILACETVRFIV